MKRIIFIILLWALPCWATTRFVGQGGDDGNDGLTYETRYATFMNLMTDFNCSGDTVVVSGANTFEIVIGAADAGTVNDRTYVIGYDVYTNDYDSDITDTTMIWAASCSTSYAINLTDAAFVTIIGLDLHVSGASGLINDDCDSLIFEQCRLSLSYNSSLIDLDTNADTDVYLNNCLLIFLGWYGIKLEDNCGSIHLNHCTLYGSLAYRTINNQSNPTGVLELTNSVIWNTNSGSLSGLMRISAPQGAAGIEIDYNSWWRTNKAQYWNWSGVWVATFAAHQDSAAFWGATNETHSYYQDPDLLYLSTTCVPDTDSPLIGTASDERDIGWYQRTPPPASSSLQRIIIVE